MGRDKDRTDPKVHRITTNHPEANDQHTLHDTSTTIIDQVPDELREQDHEQAQAVPEIRIRYLDRLDRHGTIAGRVERADTARLPDNTKHAVLLVRFDTDLVVPPTHHDHGPDAIGSPYGIVFTSDPASMPVDATPLRAVHLLDHDGDSIGTFGSVLSIDLTENEAVGQ